jgi:hypothetical protein
MREAIQEVKVIPMPPAPPAPLSSGVVLTAPLYVNTYQWYADGIIIPGAATRSLRPNQSGSFSYTYMQNGCFSPMSATVQLVYTAIADPVNNGTVIHFSPNPTSGEVFISGLNPNDEYRIYITGLTGRQVNSYEKKRGGDVFRIDASDLPAGLYITRIFNLSKKKEIGIQKIQVLR